MFKAKFKRVRPLKRLTGSLWPSLQVNKPNTILDHVYLMLDFKVMLNVQEMLKLATNIVQSNLLEFKVLGVIRQNMVNRLVLKSLIMLYCFNKLYNNYYNHDKLYNLI